MHPGEILSEYPEREKLRTRKDGYNRRQEGKSRHNAAAQQEFRQDEYHNQHAEQQEGKAYNAGNLQRQGAEPGHQIDRMLNELARGIA